MGRNINKSTIYFEKNYDLKQYNNSSNVDYFSTLFYPVPRLRDIYSKRENKFYLTGQPTINKFNNKQG